MLKKFNNKGFGLVEIMISLAIISMLTLGIYSLIVFSLRITTDNKNYVSATEIAKQKMEQIRNMPYDNVGVLLGSPPGNIPQEEIIQQEGTFKVNTYIKFEDDPYDGLIGSSTNPDINLCGLDYKIATIKVSWESRFGSKEITIFSKIIPDTIENISGYGTMKILINDRDGNPVPGALISVYNDTATTTIDVHDLPANENGILFYPVPAASNYKISAHKNGYATSTTYTASSTNPNPLFEDWSVAEGQLVEDNLEINKFVYLNIETVAQAMPDNYKINSGSVARDQKKPSISFDKNNNLYFTWQSETTTSSKIFIQKYDSSFNKQWANDIEISPGSNFQYYPDIATASSSGKSFIVWQDSSTILKMTALKKPNIKLAQKNKIYWDKNYFQNLEQKKFNLSFKYPHIKKIKFPYIINNIRNTFKIHEARAAGMIIQTKIGSPQNHNKTLSATFDSTPIEGDMLIAIAVNRNDFTNFNPPTNANGPFSVSSYSNTNNNPDVGIWHKIAQSSEPKQITINANNNVRGGVLMIMEVSGLSSSNPIDVISTNDQTSSSGLSANTGSSATTANNAFAVAAITFADNNFTTPNNSNWSSISSDSWSQTLWKDWWTGRDASLAVATANITAPAVQKATLTLSGGGSEERNSALAVFNLAVPEIASVSTINTQQNSIISPNNNQEIGGTFVIKETGSSRKVKSIIIAENGSVDAHNYLSNIRLFYDLDTSAPYDCVGENYSGSEAQFGSASSSFSLINENAFFSQSGGIEINLNKTLCLYTVLDIKSGVNASDTLEILIDNPSTDIQVDTGNVSPSTPVELNGTTYLLTPAEIKQSHYRFRNDDGDEVSATWKNAEDNPTTSSAGDNLRLRFLINNEGNLSSPVANYQLEYAKKTAACSSLGTWEILPTDNSKHWKIDPSPFLSEEEATTNLNPGISDEGNFIPGLVKNTANQTSNISLANNKFTEIEYSINSTNNAEDGTYCFRLNDALGSSLTYLEYPEISIIGDNNIFLITVDNSGTLSSIKKVNDDLSSAEQTHAKIDLKENMNSGTSTVVWQDKQNGNWDIYAQSFDLNNNELWPTELQITSSSSDEYSPDIKIDSQNNIVVVWVENDGTKKSIYAQKYDLDKNKIWLKAKKLTSSLNNESSPVLEVDESENFYLAWVEEGASSYNTYLAKYDSSGNEIWKQQANLENLSDNQYAPDLAIRNSLIYISWTDTRNGNEDIYTQKYDLNGNSLWAKDQRISINQGVHYEDYSKLIINSLDKPFAVWEDNRNTNYDIYAAEFEDPGLVTSLPNTNLKISYDKEIGSSVFEHHDINFSTNASGLANLSMEYIPSGYYIDTTNPTQNIVTRTPPGDPLLANPGDISSLSLYIE